MSGTAAHNGMFFSRAYRNPAAHNTIQPLTRAARNAPGVCCIGIILASAAVWSGRAEEPPPDLVRKVARIETATQKARSHYTYRQSVAVE